MTTRKPPLPPGFNNIIKGTCRYCQKLIFKNNKINTRATWHPHCADQYRLIHWPSYTRKKVLARDRARCFVCQKVSRNWHVDHIQPLYMAEGRIEFWLMDNLQTLCSGCHKQKTARESTHRAELRKQAKQEKSNDQKTS